MSETDTSSTLAPATSRPAVLAVLLILSLIAGAGGWFTGQGYLNAIPVTGEPAAGKEEHDLPPVEAGFATGNVVKLDPIITNLAAPEHVWIRLEAALVSKGETPVPAAMSAEIGADFLKLLRATNMLHLQGNAGLANLQAELEERARIRSQGLVEGVLIFALVIE